MTRNAWEVGRFGRKLRHKTLKVQSLFPIRFAGTSKTSKIVGLRQPCPSHRSGYNKVDKLILTYFYPLKTSHFLYPIKKKDSREAESQDRHFLKSLMTLLLDQTSKMMNCESKIPMENHRIFPCKYPQKMRNV